MLGGLLLTGLMQTILLLQQSRLWKSGRYQASHPSRYRRPSKETRIHNFGHATVADSVRDALRIGGLQREQQGQYQYQYHQQSSEEQERYHRQRSNRCRRQYRHHQQQSKTNLRMSYRVHVIQYFNLSL